MGNAKRPYKVTRNVARDSFPGPVSARITVASYASLESAIDGAKRANGQIPDETITIWHGQHAVRDVYHHGHPSKWA